LADRAHGEVLADVTPGALAHGAGCCRVVKQLFDQA
jgi:hypothetical protein